MSTMHNVRRLNRASILSIAGLGAVIGGSVAPSQQASGQQHDQHAQHAQDQSPQPGARPGAPSSGMQSGMSMGSHAMHEAMMKGMKDMRGMSMTGDADQDFASMMIHHHRQAIEMARAQIAGGKDAEIKRKAQQIIDASQKDIQDLENWRKEHPAVQAQRGR